MVKRYLSQLSLHDTLHLILNSFERPDRTEFINPVNSIGRVTSDPVYPAYSFPESPLAAMDGYAILSTDTGFASEKNPKVLTAYQRINTGQIVPGEYDAVVMIEDIIERHDGELTVLKAARPGQHVRPQGEEIKKYEMILPAHHTVRKYDVGALISYGVSRMAVKSLKVGLLPTGSELVTPGTRPEDGKVVESNMSIASLWLEEAGAGCKLYPIAIDDPDVLREAISRGIAENDMLLISAGSSAGTRDFTADLIDELGELLVHGVAIKPGKPAIIGKIDGKPVFGLPGYPLAAITVLREMVMPLLNIWGFSYEPPGSLKTRVAVSVPSDSGFDEFIFVSLSKLDEGYIALPRSRGASVQMAAVKADGYIHIPSEMEGLMAGEETDVYLIRPKETFKKAVLLSGAFNPALGHLSGLARKNEDIALHTNIVGNFGAIISLRKRACHAAPMATLSSGLDINDSYLRKFLKDEELTAVCISELEYGIMSRDPVTPEEFSSLSIINSQRDTTSRSVLEKLLSAEDTEPSGVSGFFNEVTEENQIGVAVRSGTADAGIGSCCVAKEYELSFLPLETERYELVLRNEQLDSEIFRSLLKIMRSSDFSDILLNEGGYILRHTGSSRAIS